MKVGHVLYRYAACVVLGAALAVVCMPTCKADVLGDKINELITPVNWTLGLHLGSVHSNNRDQVAGRNWNDANPGVYIRRDNVVVGTYYNSIRKESFYVGYVYPVNDWLDVVFGVVSGYNGAGYSAKPIMPMVVPSVHFDLSANVAARINIAPQAAKGGATAINFALEYKF